MKNEECRMKNIFLVYVFFILHSERSDHSSFFIYHTTPLALWRGVGGEAFILHLIIWSFP